MLLVARVSKLFSYSIKYRFGSLARSRDFIIWTCIFRRSRSLLTPSPLAKQKLPASINNRSINNNYYNSKNNYKDENNNLTLFQQKNISFRDSIYGTRESLLCMNTKFALILIGPVFKLHSFPQCYRCKTCLTSLVLPVFTTLPILVVNYHP